MTLEQQRLIRTFEQTAELFANKKQDMSPDNILDQTLEFFV